MNSRIRGLLIAVAIALALPAGLAAGQGASVATFTPPHARPGAERDAALLLPTVVLPEGARRLTREPSLDGGVLGMRGPSEAYVDIADRHAWWRVPGSWRSVLAFVHAHPPAGSREVSSGEGGNGRTGRETYANILFGWPAVTGIRTRQLTVSLAASPGDTTYLRVDAYVVWLLPRPASERIPTGVQVIDITRGLPGHAPSQSLTVTDPTEIAALVAVTNSLPTVQPAANGCNTAGPIGAIEARITFTFRASPAGAVLAVASESAGATEPGTCGPLRLSIAGIEQTPLLQGQKLVVETERELKEKI